MGSAPSSGPGAAARRQQPVPWREVFSGALGRLAFGLFLLEALTAVQILVVATVMPVIARDLSGLRLYGWAFSGGGLATVITIPLGGMAVDRIGPRKPFVVALGAFAAGTLLAGAAPTMPVFIAGRFLQGLGAGGEYAVGLGAVAKGFPEAHRARLLALIAVAWVLPGLLGPSYGALLASTIGWRWAFFTVLPLLAGAGWLTIRSFAGVAIPSPEDRPLNVRQALLLAAGAAAFLGGLTLASVRATPIVAVGLIVGIPAAIGLVRGASEQPGLAVGLVAGFLLSFSFFAVDGFVPLLLTRLRGRSVAEASIVVTLATVSWSAGSWWQSRVSGRSRPRTLVSAGAAAICLGAGGVAAGLLHGTPLVIPYVAWTVAGVGMGVAYPTVYLVTMDRAGRGTEGVAVSLLLLLDSLGVATGAGLGGAAIAIARNAGAGLRTGLGAAFGLAAVAGLGLLALTPALPSSHGTDGSY